MQARTLIIALLNGRSKIIFNLFYFSHIIKADLSAEYQISLMIPSRKSIMNPMFVARVNE
jgi:hypothetical protein